MVVLLFLLLLLFILKNPFLTLSNTLIILFLRMQLHYLDLTEENQFVIF